MYKGIKAFVDDWILGFFVFLGEFGRHFLNAYLSPVFVRFERVKDILVFGMYQKRGKYAQLLVHSIVSVVVVFGVTVGPSLVVDDGLAKFDLGNGGVKLALAGNTDQVVELTPGQMDITPVTQYSEKPRSEILDYSVEAGETLSNIASKFGVSIDTLRWANSDKITDKKDTIKAGTILKIPPVSGVIHTVKSGENIYSIAKKYKVDPQSIVDFPFNSFTNDETFALAIGQSLVIPDGTMPEQELWSIPTASIDRILTPNAGAVSATGSWIWPSAGKVTQGFKSWHKGLDIANSAGGAILAADSGTIIVAGWPDNTGYGNRVVIDHGNGLQTLYGHMSKISVVVGQTVRRGDKIGDMGSTGRSTGTHLHFEIRTGRGNANPLDALK